MVLDKASFRQSKRQRGVIGFRQGKFGFRQGFRQGKFEDCLVLDKARFVLEKASLEVLDKASGRTATWQRRQGLR